MVALPDADLASCLTSCALASVVKRPATPSKAAPAKAYLPMVLPPNCYGRHLSDFPWMHVVLILMDRGNLSPLEQFNKMKAPLSLSDFFRPIDGSIYLSFDIAEQHIQPRIRTNHPRSLAVRCGRITPGHDTARRLDRESTFPSA